MSTISLVIVVLSVAAAIIAWNILLGGMEHIEDVNEPPRNGRHDR